MLNLPLMVFIFIHIRITFRYALRGSTKDGQSLQAF